MLFYPAVAPSRLLFLLGDFNYPEINWLNQSLADNASLDCKDFFSGVNDSFITQLVSIDTIDTYRHSIPYYGQ